MDFINTTKKPKEPKKIYMKFSRKKSLFVLCYIWFLESIKVVSRKNWEILLKFYSILYQYFR